MLGYYHCMVPKEVFKINRIQIQTENTRLAILYVYKKTHMREASYRYWNNSLYENTSLVVA